MRAILKKDGRYVNRLGSAVGSIDRKFVGGMEC